MNRHRCIRTDADDPIAGNGDRLGNGEDSIDGNDLAVLENEISRAGGEVD
jgi:hypothetical protein